MNPPDQSPLPCPFCGMHLIVENNDTGDDDDGFWEWVECHTCGAKHNDWADWKVVS